MPDESCRTCGGDLRVHSQCEGCRKVVQKICQSCSSVTRRQFHAQCQPKVRASSANTVCVLAVREESAAKRLNVRPLAVAAVIAGVFVMGIALGAFPYLLQAPIQQADTASLSPGGINSDNLNPDNIPAQQVRYTSAVREALSNCLAYGSGESVTVTCPTQYGYVYKAILEMPQGLSDRFSESVFSIRGVSVSENSDGSVTLQYENTGYRTGFFAS